MDGWNSPRLRAGYGWAAAGVALATAGFWLARPYLDKGQASLLYLPVVIACAIRFGFGPAVLGAILSFGCWDFFFLPPAYTLTIADPKDWLSLFVFLLAAVTTARLASSARAQTGLAQAREAEIATLFQASEAISQEVRADKLLAALTRQLQTLIRAPRCLVFQADRAGLLVVAPQTGPDPAGTEEGTIRRMAEAAFEHRQTIGFGRSQALWAKALDAAEKGPPPALGVYVPLQADGTLVGVLHVGARADGRTFSATDERLILTLANHAAVVIAREALADRAAQAAALREGDALKDSLLSLVSHELRTPLAAIKATASGLLQEGADWPEPARRESLAAIDAEADRLGGLVSNLLDLSRLEAGAWRPAKDWCDVAEVAGTALDRLPPAAQSRVQLDVAPDLPLVQADYTQIALVLTNLLENAVKYTSAGSPISLSIRPAQNGQDEAAGGVLVSVRDCGLGLAPGEEERVFERFYRSPSHANGPVHGTGLGLALCRAVVRAHGGRIWAGSAPARAPSGAVFSVFLPHGAAP